ncbi:Na+/H+ antiporter NhaA [Actinobacillus pleuropneumoniae]|uniref:Na(+)/H(+) antiporter NhaA n=3 Tax=Actinobacillus pleuropneumoniae TaxID=715 RepID=NHAA_ACTPJ|nr:Na+/H+ antiporter NhaA [Actinobacillus pleuropneumoniae]B0BTX5.1 RecName: Full=Na(+)/H(+) antiporter NhaA; AltName: Full=Sodium/proton antiporter NhaA [Actinobacillus pleuropneumoniae serovar 3 str. JL03]ABY70542.1 Na+/H+ antiporter 1 [Actinobacillus pleuropneumoniae serovar 3 str. JL03]EFL79338.1 Na+/H+ antiporter 1 [Actinobacillus pleuropneumoniae serovar 2 str. 4226]EFL80957.1 Na+/H+ antiporter 1 [Actinobacillus pleuropneumoniae serovar 6 str. Femo]EFM86676.1 Sodium/proton antiporter Nha
MLKQIQKFLKLEAASGILLLVSALLAMIFANTDLNQLYFSFLQTEVAIKFGAFSIDKPLLMWVNDGFMAVFFILVGMEVKRELFEGSLSSYQKAIFPAVAALGGMIIPALVYWFINQNSPEYQQGWAIPMATDIAFALGIVALLSKQVPPALKVFLLALAIIDDLGAIIVIALFFSHEMSMQALTIASIAIVILVAMNRYKVTGLINYAIIGTILWASVLKSGVHATLAGVIIGFCIPLRGKNGEAPLHHLEHALAPWCSFAILPLFAFSNAGVSLEGMSLDKLASPLPLGVALGLIIGKPVGVFLFSYVAVLLGIAKVPEGINLKQIFAIAVLCGIGFTMSMFIAGLAFGEEDASESVLALARLGILMGTFVAAIIGYFLLKITTKPSLMKAA